MFLTKDPWYGKTETDLKRKNLTPFYVRCTLHSKIGRGETSGTVGS